MTALNHMQSLPFRGSQLPVFDVGSGPSLGYLHGIVGNPAVPEFVQILASHGRRVVGPSLPGFSGSQPCEGLRTVYDWVAALSEIVDGAGLAGKTVVASSIGAMLALELAAVRPEAFDRLILVSPMGLWDDADPVKDLFANTLSEERQLLTQEVSRTASFYDGDSAAEPAALVQHSVDRFVTRSTVASLIWPLPEFGLSSRIHRVKCPVTLIWGEQDRLVPVSYLKRFERLLPRVEGAHVVRSAGHLAELDQPAQIATLIEALTATSLQ
jgi:pimeloyl-ACP methyl ester carboxylesterase